MCKLFFNISFLVIVLCSPVFSWAQTVVDPCFSTPTPNHPFGSTGDIFNTRSSDLCEWNGAAWVGPWSHANVNIPPPCGAPVGARGVWTGASSGWTTGGEAFAFRVTAGFVTGSNYTFNFTTVSHGNSSTGSFAPRIYTNTNGSVTGAYLMGQITNVGTAWATNPYNFTAVAAQAGHNWVIIHTSTVTGSGMTLSFCPCTVLPINLINFSAECIDEKATLNWTTESEVNNDYFTIERSKDAITFEEIATVKGNGNSSGLIDYRLEDSNPFNGTNYYRLKQTDFDGAYEYHGVRTILCEQSGNVSIFPNPFENSFSIQVSEDFTNPLTIEVYDYLGRKVHSQLLEINATKIEFDDVLPTGNYFVKVFNNEFQLTERLVKLK